MRRLSDYKRLILTAFVLGVVIYSENGIIHVNYKNYSIHIYHVMAGGDNTRGIRIFVDNILIKEVITDFEVPEGIDRSTSEVNRLEINKG